MPNYELKANIMNEMPVILKAVKGLHKANYIRSKFVYSEYSKTFLIDEKDYHRLEQLKADEELALEIYTKEREIFDECERICKADVERRLRLRKRINLMFLQGQCYFVTLTFSDDTLQKTDYKTRRRYVTWLLKDISNSYVGNVDFGKTNGREHYHAIIQSDKLSDIQFIKTKRYGWICSQGEQFDKWKRLGFYSIKSCGTDELDKQKMASYVTKLTNHAVKETTKRNVLIYSR